MKTENLLLLGGGLALGLILIKNRKVDVEYSNASGTLNQRGGKQKPWIAQPTYDQLKNELYECRKKWDICNSNLHQCQQQLANC